MDIQWKRISAKRRKRLNQAVSTYFARQSRREHPNGHFDHIGRWKADSSEKQACCNGIRRASQQFPYSLNSHCRTAKHIASLYEVDLRVLRHEIRRVTAAARVVTGK